MQKISIQNYTRRENYELDYDSDTQKASLFYILPNAEELIREDEPFLQPLLIDVDFKECMRMLSQIFREGYKTYIKKHNKNKKKRIEKKLGRKILRNEKLSCEECKKLFFYKELEVTQYGLLCESCRANHGLI